LNETAARADSNVIGTGGSTSKITRRRDSSSRLNTELNIEVAKPLIFDREVSKMASFVTAYRLYIRMKMRKILVEEQI